MGISWWLWMVAGFLLLGAELFVPSFFLFFFGLGAVCMGLLQLVAPGLPLWAELLLFIGLSMLWLTLFRQRILSYFEKRNPRKNVDSIAGETAVALEDIPPAAIGKAELRGASWPARNTGPAPVAKGERCRVDRVDGLTLLIRGM
jgi:membrane protein implicated in regulation of membrane protease activity